MMVVPKALTIGGFGCVRQARRFRPCSHVRSSDNRHLLNSRSRHAPVQSAKRGRAEPKLMRLVITSRASTAEIVVPLLLDGERAWVLTNSEMFFSARTTGGVSARHQYMAA